MKPSCSKIKFNNLISPLEIAEKHRLTLSPKLDKIKQSTFGQYFTPSIASKYMASLFDFNNKSSLKLLDPGAGVGSLAAAVVEILCQEKRPPQNIEFTLVENDSSLIDNLYEVMNLCVEKCKQSNINFEFEIINDDFIKYALNIINSNSQQLCLFNNDINTIKFDLVIMNPPYKKINNFSEAKKNLNNHNIEVTNLYSAFLWLANDLLNTNGELVAITPRSFCNGPYFKAFRENIFSKSSLTEIHLFNSRNSIFNYDKVLQENIIFKLIKCIKRDFVKVKFSDDITGTEKIKSKFFDYKSIINYNDPNLFIHIPSSDQFNEIVDTMTQLKYFLSDIGIEASTGKIVDFRNKEYLVLLPFSCKKTPLLQQG